jgi:DNA-binding NarL/FixJ family response regulator
VGVLIVDGDASFAASLARVLAAEGIAVLGVTPRGADAIGMVRRLAPQVVLLATQLPGEDTAAVVTEIRRSTGALVIMMTASSHDRALVEAMDAGCSGFLSKVIIVAESSETTVLLAANGSALFRYLTQDRTGAAAHAVLTAAADEAVISTALLAGLLPQLNRAPGCAEADITDGERQILELLARGWDSRLIASELYMSIDAVRHDTQSLLTKLGVQSRLEAVSTAVRTGLLDVALSA